MALIPVFRYNGKEISPGKGGNHRVGPNLYLGYGLILLISYTAAASFLCCLSILRHQSFLMPLAGLFFLYLLDAVITFAAEINPLFYAWYDRVTFSAPSVQTALYLGISFFTLRSVWVLLKKPSTAAQRVILLGLGVWYLLVPLGATPMVRVFLYYEAHPVFLLLLSLYALRKIKGMTPEKQRSFRRLKPVLFLTVLWSLLLGLEFLYVVLYVNSYTATASHVYIQTWAFCQDLLRLQYSLIVFFQVLGRSGPFSVRAPSGEALSSSVPREKDALSPFEQYATSICLTKREREVFSLLLENRTHQEIRQALFISAGTVKAHIHNIYQKAGVTRRDELLRQYDMYLGSFADQARPRPTLLSGGSP